MPLFPWLRPDKPDTDPKPEPTPEPTPSTPWLKVWWTLRGINMRAIWPALMTIPVIVFFAVSGIVAWCWLLLRGVYKFFRSLIA